MFGNVHFIMNYDSSILDPLPQNSIIYNEYIFPELQTKYKCTLFRVVSNHCLVYKNFLITDQKSLTRIQVIYKSTGENCFM